MSQIKLQLEMKAANNSFLISSSVLKFITGNRNVRNLSKVSSIENAMKNGEYIAPIIVDRSTLSIIDGQHRYEAACNLWKQGIKYELNIVMEDFKNPLLAAINHNSNATNWCSTDYVEAYIVDGRNSFVLLKKFVEEHPLFQNIIATNINYMGAAQLLTSSACYANIPRGTLKVTISQCKDADVIYKELEKIVPITGKTIMSKSIILAYIELRPYIKDFNKFLKTLKKRFVMPKTSSKRVWKDALREVIDRI